VFYITVGTLRRDEFLPGAAEAVADTSTGLPLDNGPRRNCEVDDEHVRLLNQGGMLGGTRPPTFVLILYWPSCP